MIQLKGMSRWLRLAIGLVVGLVAVGALLSGATQIVAYVAAHPPRERLTQTPAAVGLTFEEVAFHTSDGIQLKGWFIPSDLGNAAVILGHGFSRSRQELLDVAQMLNRNCYNVLMFDWRAHGESGGARTTFGHDEVRDLSAALDFVSSRPEVDHQRIGVLGKSMGAAIAIRAGAVLPQLRAIVADSAFSSLQESIDVSLRRHGPLGMWPLSAIVRSLGTKTTGVDPELVRPIDDIDEISPRPVLILQGGSDELVPAETGARLYAAAAEPKYLWYEPGVAHVMLSTRFPAEYESRVVRFFDSALQGAAASACARPVGNPVAWAQH